MTLNVMPATVKDPDRDVNVLFCETVYPTVPLPVPGDPKEMVIQLVLLEAVRAQSLALAVMLMTPSLLVYPKLALVGDSINEQAAKDGNTAAR